MPETGDFNSSVTKVKRRFQIKPRGGKTMNSGQLYRARAFPGAPPLTETEFWRAVNERDVHRIQCDRSHMCGENARWASRSAMPCIYVCDYHRRVFEATGTFWKDEGTT